jgi:hypothetical protein
MGLPIELSTACIAHNGNLTDKYTYINKLRALRDEKEKNNIQVVSYRKYSEDEET